MKVPLRRIGNSLGVLLTKATLDAWGLREGDVFGRVDEEVGWEWGAASGFGGVVVAEGRVVEGVGDEVGERSHHVC